jgi:hypothetical protein
MTWYRRSAHQARSWKGRWHGVDVFYYLHTHNKDMPTQPRQHNKTSPRTWRTLGSIKRLPSRSKNTTNLAIPFPPSGLRANATAAVDDDDRPSPPVLLPLLLPPCGGG